MKMRIHPISFPALLTLSLLQLLPSSVQAEDVDNIEGRTEGSTQESAEGNTGDKPWLDESHDYVSTKADDLASWMDSFFGVTRVDTEAAYSTLRLRPSLGWDEADGWDPGVSLRGKVNLPNLNERVSLLFSDDDSGSVGDELLRDQENRSDDVALQITGREGDRDRVDFRLGFNSGLNPKLAARYRYQMPFSETISGRFRQELLYRTDDRFGTDTRLDLDVAVSSNRLLQWYNRMRWDEKRDGVGWNTGVTLNQRLSNNRVIGVYSTVNGRTQPTHLTESYGFGMRYRQNLNRKWLFLEVQPGYFWRRDTFEDERRGTAEIVFRLEAVFTGDVEEALTR